MQKQNQGLSTVSNKSCNFLVPALSKHHSFTIISYEPLLLGALPHGVGASIETVGAADLPNRAEEGVAALGTKGRSWHSGRRGVGAWAHGEAGNLRDAVDNDLAALGLVRRADLVAALVRVLLGDGVDERADDEDDHGRLEHVGQHFEGLKSGRLEFRRWKTEV